MAKGIRRPAPRVPEILTRIEFQSFRDQFPQKFPQIPFGLIEFFIGQEQGKETIPQLENWNISTDENCLVAYSPQTNFEVTLPLLNNRQRFLIVAETTTDSSPITKIAEFPIKENDEITFFKLL